MQDLTGKTIGKYRIIEPQGKGGMATVFKAFDTQLERDVAIKLISLEQFGPAIVEKMRMRFDREAKTLAKLTHPNIVNIIDYGEYEGIPYLVMPFLHGGTLKQFLGKPMPLVEAAGLLTPIADALAYAHQKGIIHRDVKPANILFTEGGQPMLTDFGIARLLSNEEGGVTLTATGMGIGTPEYMSPEQGLGHEVDGRTDIYSLGTVLYELITGQKPYTANTPMEIVLKQSTIPLKKPSLIIPEIGNEADQVLLKAMAKEPEERYANMKDFKNVLGGLCQKSQVFTPHLEFPTQAPVKNEKIEKPTDYFVTETEQHLETKTPLNLKEKRVAPERKARKPIKLVWFITSVFVFSIAVLVGITFLFPQSGFSKATGLANILGVDRFAPSSTLTSPTRLAYFTDTPNPTPTSTREPFIVPTETLRINIGGFPNTLDPQRTSWANDIAHLQLIYEGLTRLNSDLETVPGAAERWEYNADGTELTFWLRQDLRYSDGALLNAKRFEDSLLRNMDPTLNGDFASMTDDIVGAYDYRTADPGKLSPEQLTTLRNAVFVHAYDLNGQVCTDYEQEDCLILKIGTNDVIASLPTILSMSIAYPAREELISAGGDSWWNDPANLVGNGPYILETLEKNSVAYFRPNPAYWGTFAKVNIEYYYMIDSAQAFTAYKKDQVDIISLAAEDLAAARSDPTLSKEISIYPGSCTYALMMNQTKAPFNDQKVREAFAYGLDREKYVNEILQGLGSPTLTWIPEGSPGYDASENHWAFNPEKAKQAMIASSYGSPENLPQVSFTFSNTTRNVERLSKLASYYKDLFGINIKLNPVDGSAFSEMIMDSSTAPQLYISGWCADFADPRDWLSFYWKSGGYADRIGFSYPGVDSLLKQADVELNPVVRLELYKEAQRMIIKSVPAAFFYNNVNAFLIKPFVKNITTTPMDSAWAGIYSVANIKIEK